MVPVLGQKVQDQFDRWEFHDREFRQYCIDKPKYTGTETRTHLWNFYKSLVSFQMFGSIQNKKKKQ